MAARLKHKEDKQVLFLLKEGLNVRARPSKNIDDILRKDAGASSELDYTEQTSWLLFLKYLTDALEQDKADGG